MFGQKIFIFTIYSFYFLASSKKKLRLSLLLYLHVWLQVCFSHIFLKTLFQVKESNDKRGWSFRKKSARHRVLSNTVIAESPSSANKEHSECTNFNFQPLPEPNVVEKIYTANYSDEKPQLSSFENSQVAETNVIESEKKVDVNPPESDVIIIQAAIRGLLVCFTFVEFC